MSLSDFLFIHYSNDRLITEGRVQVNQIPVLDPEHQVALNDVVDVEFTFGPRSFIVKQNDLDYEKTLANKTLTKEQTKK